MTAGNASGINDGAAAVMVMTAQKALVLGLMVSARIASFGTTGLDPAIMGMGPVSASQRALARAGWKASDVDLFELNEAFAAQACAVNKALDIDPAVNVTAVPLPLDTPSVRPDAAFWSPCCTKCNVPMPRRAWQRCALAVAWVWH